MPTGYTSMIDDDPNMTTKDWFLKGLIRAFGICISLREDESNLPPEEIRRRLQESGRRNIKYHEKELNKVNKEYKEANARTEEEWKKAFQVYEEDRIQQNMISKRKADKKRERHDKVFLELMQMFRDTSLNEVTKNIAKFGLDQLALVRDECYPYIREPVTLEQFISNTLDRLESDVKYHSKHMVKSTDRLVERLAFFDLIVKDVNTFFSNKRTDRCE